MHSAAGGGKRGFFDMLHSMRSWSEAWQWLMTVPSRLEPTGLLRSNWKRPDCVKLAPCHAGSWLVLHATCPDTFTISYRTYATQEGGKVAENAEQRKEEKYWGLPTSHSFNQVAIETMGEINPTSTAFLKDLGHRIAMESGEPRSRAFSYSGCLWQFKGGTVLLCKGCELDAIYSATSHKLPTIAYSCFLKYLYF